MITCITCINDYLYCCAAKMALVDGSMDAHLILAASDAALERMRPYLSWTRSLLVSPPDVLSPFQLKTDLRLAMALQRLVVGFQNLPMA